MVCALTESGNCLVCTVQKRTFFSYKISLHPDTACVGVTVSSSFFFFFFFYDWNAQIKIQTLCLASSMLDGVWKFKIFKFCFYYHLSTQYLAVSSCLHTHTLQCQIFPAVQNPNFTMSVRVAFWKEIGSLSP